MSAITNDTRDREMVITRLINAPRERVWEAFTTPEQVKIWWGPEGFTNTIAEMEVKPGGTWRFVMHSADGIDFPNKIVFDKVEAPSLLTYSHMSDDGTAKVLFDTTVTFEEKEDRTLLTMRALFNTAAERERVIKEYGAEEGGKQTISRLETFLYTRKDSTAFVITRELAAPRDLVFDCWTSEEHLQHWWGPKGFVIEVKGFDLRPGGIFHYRMAAPTGEMWGRFVFKEIVKPEKLVFINSFSNPGADITRAPFGIQFPLEVVVQVFFEETATGTRITLKSGPIRSDLEEMDVFAGMHASMQAGFGGTFEQLKAYIEKIKE